MNDIYQNELLKCKIYNSLKNKCKNQPDQIETEVIKLVNDVVQYACDKSKVIIKYLPEYTLHDETHLFRTYKLMERIIPMSTLEKLSIPEMMLLTLTAFLHDIGMAPLEEHLRAWRKDWKEDTPTDKEYSEFLKFDRFRSTFPQKISEIERLRKNNHHSKAELIEGYIISEYIRNTHEDRAREFIATDWIGKIKYKDADLTNDLAQLCYSHGNDALSLLELEMNVLCDENTYVCLPFIGVILRISDLLDFDAKRTPSVLFSHLTVRNPVSLEEWQKHRSIQAWSIKPNRISFNAKCKHPAIEKSIKDFCDYIDDELKYCSTVISRLHDEFREEEMRIYKIPLAAKVDRSKIRAEKDIRTNKPLYLYRDTSFELSKNQVIDLLMGTKLYDDTKAALRELIQNSIDACLLANSLCKKLEYIYKPEIIIRFYSEGGQDFLEVEDNGIGMNLTIIDNYYSKIGSSYYKSNEFYELKAVTGLKFEPISRFGIGILSCFMVSDTIEVETRKLLDDGEKDSPFNISIEGYDSIFTIKNGNRKQHGTKTRIILRPKENPWDKMSKRDFINYVKHSVPNPPVKISIITDKKDRPENTEVIDENSFSKLSVKDLKDYRWDTTDYINEISICLDNKDYGFKGEAIVAILEKNNLPTSSIEGISRIVQIENESYELENKIELKRNEIEKTSTIIEIGIDSGIETSESPNSLVKSKSSLSIHGIIFPTGIIPSYLTRHKKTCINWPLPILLILDITGKNDLDLNSARSEIVFNTKWNNFEENLAYIICTQLKKKFKPEYWERFIEVILDKNESQNFKAGVEKAQQVSI